MDTIQDLKDEIIYGNKNKIWLTSVSQFKIHKTDLK